MEMSYNSLIKTNRPHKNGNGLFSLIKTNHPHKNGNELFSIIKTSRPYKIKYLTTSSYKQNYHLHKQAN